jgi:malate dehydrogenase (oxaloacetate-decarboxylating)
VLDCTYRVQIAHRLGQLALVAGAIAEAEGLIGDVETISVGRENSVREITVEVRDIDQARRVAELLGELDGVRVLWYQDRALIRHEGGKLRVDAIHPVRTVQEMRDVYTPGVARVSQAIESGALQAGAAAINREMKLAAAYALAELTQDDELVPNVLDQKVHDAVADAVREAAERSGVARPELATAGL